MREFMPLLALVAVLGCAKAAPEAEESALDLSVPESHFSLAWQDDGALALKAAVITPNGCYHAGGPAMAGPPEGADLDMGTPAVRLPIAMEGGVCTMALKHVHFELTLEGVPETADRLMIFELWPTGEPVRVQTVDLPPR